MDKDEFLNILQKSLEGEIPESEIKNNVNFYREYITDDRKLEQLGNPRLIAKTVIDTYKASTSAAFSRKSVYNKAGYEEGNYSFNRERFNNEHNGENQQNYNDETNYDENKKAWNRNYSLEPVPWYYKLIGSILLILLFILVITVGGVLLNLFFSVVFPVLLLVLIVKMVMRIVKHR